MNGQLLRDNILSYEVSEYPNEILISASTNLYYLQQQVHNMNYFTLDKENVVKWAARAFASISQLFELTGMPSSMFEHFVQEEIDKKSEKYGMGYHE